MDEDDYSFPYSYDASDKSWSVLGANAQEIPNALNYGYQDSTNNRNNNNSNRNTNFGNSNTRQRNAYYSQNDENDLIENDEENYQDTLAKSMIELANSIKNLKE